MHDLSLIATLAGGLTAALVAGYVTERLRLSPIVGYLLAGIAVGLLMGWMFHGFVGAFLRLALAAVVLVPLIVGYLAWRRYRRRGHHALPAAD